MTYKSSQNSNSIDLMQLENLEHKLKQDLLAHKKVLKWTKTIEARIERTKAQIKSVKQHEIITRKNLQIKAASKIPVPSRLNQKIQPVQLQTIRSTQYTRTQESNKSKFTNEPKQKTIHQSHSTKVQNETFQNKYKAHFDPQESYNFTSSANITNLIDACILNRFVPLLNRLETVEAQINSNECLIEEAKNGIKTISESVAVNAKESEHTLNNLKNILINFYSKDLT